ncbi:polysaccharide biosynthesis tyrosine autokinase [Janibacter limosus]|uniref:polysaccharide biosynthesis tyrosine autokinase n=1 Tax=Janibacter limosus TaxID=53458 RepID=UPI001FE01F1C|nr:polysaccharide biosynthesis tyrosine autokinase [Janibacter limosus]
METRERYGVELQDYLRILRKRWVTIVVTALVVLGLAALLSAVQTKQYTSSTQFFVSVSGTDTAALQQGSTFTQQRVKSYAQLLKTPRALNPVIEQLGDDSTVSGLAGKISVTTPPDTVLLEVSVTDSSPDRAQRIATAIGETFPEVVSEVERPDGSKGTSPIKVSLVEPATTNGTPTSPVPVRNLALGLVLGLLLGFGLALVRHMLDTTVRTDDDVEEITEEPVIGAVHFDPRAGKEPLIVESDPSSPRAEAFRAVRTNLMFVDAANHPKTILLTSSIPGEGKSTTIANLALTLANSGSSVCLIEGDLRRPRLLDYLGLEGSAGLTDVLIDRADLDDVLQPYGSDRLEVIGAGAIPPNPSELLASEAMSLVLARLAVRFDYVLIDTPPVLPVTDAVVLSTKVDGVIVLVGTTIVHKEQLSATLEALSAVNNTLLGLVLNRVGHKSAGGYGASYYGYYKPETHPTSRSARNRGRRRNLVRSGRK